MGVKIQKLGVASLQTELLLLNQQKLLECKIFQIFYIKWYKLNLQTSSNIFQIINNKYNYIYDQFNKNLLLNRKNIFIMLYKLLSRNQTTELNNIRVL